MPFIERLAAGVFVVAAPWNSIAGESAQAPMVLRALGPHLGENTIRYIARNAESKRFDNVDVADEKTSTPRFIINQLCGSLTNAYYQEFLAANNLKDLSLDEPLGARVANFSWPACLYVRKYATGLKKTVEANETAWDIARRFTGGDVSKDSLNKVFKNSANVDLQKLQPNQKLLVAYQSLPTVVVPKVSASEFTLAMARAASKDGKQINALIREATPPDGDIFVGAPQVDKPVKCKALGAPVVNASSIEEFYKFTAAKLVEDGTKEPRRAEVVIIDNGFFGADQRINPDHFSGSPFPAKYFKRDDRTVIAQTIDLQEAIYPLNFEYGLIPDETSGHGTHVAGLVLGGPSFVASRDRIMGGKPWARITVLNAGKGTRKIQRGVLGTFMDTLKVEAEARIVNMSIGFPGLSDMATRDRFTNLFASTHWNLYVVSAGNNGDDVVSTSVYPAALGGDMTSNVMTVAALDGDYHLSSFSNHSARAVDIAAPGCQIPSWISNHPAEIRLSGTSQAAPLVTFAAVLLRTLAPDVALRALKQRIIASGDLLEPEDQRKTAYRVRLNIGKALFLYHDYISLSGANAGVYLGDVQFFKGIRCHDAIAKESHPIEDIYAYKHQANEQWLFPGRNAGKVAAPCFVLKETVASLKFVASHKVNESSVEPMGKELTVPLSEVKEVVFRLQ